MRFRDNGLHRAPQITLEHARRRAAIAGMPFSSRGAQSRKKHRAKATGRPFWRKAR